MSLSKSALRRLFLLTVLAFGVICMHTLGHDGFTGHGGSMPAEHAMTGQMDGPAMIAQGRIVLLDGGSSPGSGVDAFAVCLAILSATLLIVITVLLMSAIRPLGLFGLLLAMPGSASRGPPSKAPLGLRLADLSVMRA